MTDLVHSVFASIPGGAEAAGATMLEKAAMALAAHFGCEWETMRDADREMICGYARAVLMAVREPTNQMEIAGLSASNGAALARAKLSYTAMIDAILADGEGR